MNPKKTRDPALDMIRCIAFLCIICAHFLLHTGFGEQTVAGKTMLVMTVMRNSFVICVPLFLMLTGYLIQSKEPGRNYYPKIFRILYVYLGASFICGFFRVFYLKINSVPNVIIRTLAFETAPYAWYIEMYIGLFLLIPFLNTMYDALCTQRKKQALIATLLFLTALPSLLNTGNIYRFTDLQWWLRPSAESTYTPLIPDYWADLFPFTYFFLGKYLREYPVRFKPKQIAAFGIPVFLFTGLYSYYRSYGHVFISGFWQSHGSVFMTLQSVLVFCFFVNLDCTRLPSAVKAVLAKISDLSLGAYLTSWVFDEFIYTRLNDAVSGMRQRLMWFPVTVTLVLIGSLICSYGIDLSYSLIRKNIHRYTKQEIRD